MSEWNQDVEWVPLSEINGGKQYVAADGVTYDDFNKIIQNMTYLKTHGGKINVDLSDAYVEDGILYIKKKEV